MGVEYAGAQWQLLGTFTKTSAGTVWVGLDASAGGGAASFYQDVHVGVGAICGRVIMDGV